MQVTIPPENQASKKIEDNTKQEVCGSSDLDAVENRQGLSFEVQGLSFEVFNIGIEDDSSGCHSSPESRLPTRLCERCSTPKPLSMSKSIYCNGLPCKLTHIIGSLTVFLSSNVLKSDR